MHKFICICHSLQRVKGIVNNNKILSSELFCGDFTCEINFHFHGKNSMYLRKIYTRNNFFFFPEKIPYFCGNVTREIIIFCGNFSDEIFPRNKIPVFRGEISGEKYSDGERN